MKNKWYANTEKIRRVLRDVYILVEFYEVLMLAQVCGIGEVFENLLGVKVDLVRKSTLRTEIRESVLNEADT